MFLNTSTKVYDGDYEILFSDSFNIYENRLIINNFLSYSVEFVFDDAQFDKEGGNISVLGDEQNKKITVSVKNFRNTLGSSSSIKLPMINLQDGRKIYLSVYGKSISTNSSFLNITINFYLK